MNTSERLCFWEYRDEIGPGDPIFRPDDLGIVFGQDGDAVMCLLTDERGMVLRGGDILSAEKFIRLTYTPAASLRSASPRPMAR